VLEREQALKIKHTISQTKPKRQGHRLRHSLRHPRPELDPFSAEKASSLNLPLPSPTQENVVAHGGTALQDHPRLQIGEEDLNASAEMMWSEPFYNTGSPTEHFFNQQDSIVISNQHLFGGGTGIEHASRELNSALSGFSERVHTSAYVSPAACEDNARWDNSVSGEAFQPEANAEAFGTFCEPTLSASYDNNCVPRVSSSENQGGLSSFTHMNTPYTPITLGDHVSRSACSSISTLYGDTEDILFMYYLDQVFHTQFPFYHLTGRRGRGWLFAILRRAKSAYHAAIALSEYHQLTVRPNSSIASRKNNLRAKGSHYDLALREIQLSIAQSHTWNGSLCFIRRMEALTSTLQLLFFEVLLLLLRVIFNANIP